jgi:fluoride exporter
MERLLWICLAGAAGTGARYLVSVWAAERLGTTFPYGTLVVNLTGCFLIALVMHAAFAMSWPPLLRSALAVGFLGGFTTYSSFNYETSSLLQAGATAPAAANALATLVGGVVAGWLGLLVARQIFGH